MVTLNILFQVLKAYSVYTFYALIIYKKSSYNSLIQIALAFINLNVDYLCLFSILTKSFLFLKYKIFVN